MILCRSWCFSSAMILNIAEFLKTKKISMKLYGVDTFEGFPENTLTSKHDHPIYFNNLFEDGLISEEHFLKAKERTNGFKLKEHLTTHYFNHMEGLFYIQNYENVNLLKLNFVISTTNLKKRLQYYLLIVIYICHIWMF